MRVVCAAEMLRVKTLEEAMEVAKHMCARHPDLVRSVGPTQTARDVALKIFLQEIASRPEELSSIAASPQRTALNFTSIDEQSPAQSPVQSDRHDVPDVSPSNPARSNSAAATDRTCFYCDDASTSFCKNTGRRHETIEEKNLRLWRHIYRQLHVASNFISTARLEKKNTCVEEFEVELNL